MLSTQTLACSQAALLKQHGGQTAAIGRNRQKRLLASKIAVIGCGRVGSAFVLGAHAAGVGSFVLIDPQYIEEEQIGPSVFAHNKDIGRSKVDTLCRYLAIRSGVNIEPLAFRVEAVNLDRLLNDVHLVVCCANNVQTRLYVERSAISRRLPVIQAAVYDSRQQLGGMITVNRPGSPELACYGCLLPSHRADRQDNSALLTTATAVVGQLAAHLAVVLLSDYQGSAMQTSNLYFLNLEQCAVESLRVERRHSCAVCGSPLCKS